jgi:hypothetical protein
MYVERFEYICPDCKKKGIVTDVLLNPEMMIIRGRCPACDLQGAYKIVDRVKLQAEYEALSEVNQVADQQKGQPASTWCVLRFNVRGA